MPRTTLELLKNGIKANYADAFRQGNLINLPARGSLIFTGDLHGHRRNFERILSFADIPHNPDRHVILHEIIHGGEHDSHGGCLSYKLLFEAILFKIAFPKQVHIIMGNHDTACVTGTEIIKDGREMNRAMKQAMSWQFKEHLPEIEAALKDYLLSQPLAVRCENRIWISHSLPDEHNLEKFNKEIFDRPLTLDDIARPGSAYFLTWGRRHSKTLLDQMSRILDADIFLLGHQPQTQGWKKHDDKLIILASDHNHGCLLPVDLGRSYTVDELANDIVPLASVE